MKLFIVATFFTLFASLVAATPMNLLQVRSCDVVSCVEALGPPVEACGEVVVDKGKSFKGDVDCVLKAVDAAKTVPTKCSGCKSTLEADAKAIAGGAQKVGNVIASGAKTAVSGVKKAASKVKSVLGSIF